MLGWNRQEVFRGKHPPFKRLEEEFDRTMLSEALRHWSLAHQQDLSDTISRLQLPILWVVGSER